MKVLINLEGNRYLWEKEDLHTHFGVIRSSKIKNGVIKSDLGKEFIVFDAGFVDKLEKIKRGPAIITKKDIGEIIEYTGINKNSKIVDGGTGCGVLAAFLGNVSNCVVSYEKNKAFFNLAKENMRFLGVNVKLKNKNIENGIDEKNLDLITLDLLEPWKVFSHAQKRLKSGSFLVCYLTNIIQVIECVKHLERFYIEKIFETIEREWIAEGLKVRPRHIGLLHTGWLLFARKI